MGVSIQAKFTPARIRAYMQEQYERFEQALIMRLRRVGETFVKNARENGQYNDVTGNLRNSVGYIIIKNGEIIHSNFKKSGSGAGLRFAEETAHKFPKGIGLIVVAGEEYAAVVESRGKDVLTASSIQAEIDLKKSLDALQKKISKKR